MRSFFAAASLAALCVVSCSSANFDVASSGDGGTNDTGGTDPCAPVDGVAKFCVPVSPASGHPGYDSSSTGSLPLDGKGILSLILYPKDPIANPGTTPLPPIVYGGGSGTEVDIDADFPITFADSAPEGTYWFIAAFEDDTTSPRDYTKSDSSLPGDFISVPTIDASFHVQLPQLTLSKGTTQTLPPLTIHAVRRVIGDITPTAELRTLKLGNSSIHGDGPIEFIIYDGQLDSAPTLYDAKVGDCIRLFNPDAGTGYPIKVPFNTTIDGTHNVVAALFDYMIAFPSGGGKTTGTILSPIKDLATAKIAQVNPGGQWTTETEIQMSYDDAFASDAAPADTFTCH